MTRFGVLVSGGGTNLQAILDAHSDGRLQAEIAVVISNRKKAQALERARAAGVPAKVITHHSFPDRQEFEQALIERLAEHQVDWVVLAGFMRVLTPLFLSAFPQRVVNIHPALLPAFPGLDGQGQAFAHGVKVAGCTVHLVDEGTDTGPILAQEAVTVRDDDDLESLKARILEVEHRIFTETLQKIASSELVLEGRRARFVGTR
ncbi:MAG: phosphoribosylglycinamide formyltransferase [Deltaproteobacteria bacterium]|nr:phosphoribosylglycinamide formyltransferase [Deltaproteobacteria bacterium]